jgi:hypothetical protein
MPARHRLLLPVVVLVALGGLAACGIPRVKPMARVGVLDIEGDIEVRNRSGSARGASDADDLGLDEETVFQPRLDVDWGPVHLSAEGFGVDYSGRGEAEAQLAFGGTVISRGTKLDTDLSGDFVTGSVVVDPFPIPTVDLGIGLGVGYLAYDLEFDSREAPVRLEIDDELPFAFLVFRAAAQFGSFAFLGTARGLSLEWEDDDITYYEIDVSARYRPFGDDEGVLEGYVAVGYRYLSIDYSYEPSDGKLELDVDLSGPYLALELWF